MADFEKHKWNHSWCWFSVWFQFSVCICHMRWWCHPGESKFYLGLSDGAILFLYSVAFKYIWIPFGRNHLLWKYFKGSISCVKDSHHRKWRHRSVEEGEMSQPAWHSDTYPFILPFLTSMVSDNSQGTCDRRIVWGGGPVSTGVFPLRL